MQTKRILATTALALALSTGSAMAQGAFNPEANAGAEANSSATAGAQAGAVAGAKGGNASVKNKNTNVGINAQKQGQEQSQGQLQGQQQSNYGKNVQGQGQSLDGGANNSDQSVTVEGDDYEAPAIAPNLSALTGTTCMGSSSASAGWTGAAFGLGTTWVDEECQRREAMKLIGSLPDGTTIRGVEAEKLLGEMARGLTGVPGALAAIKNEGGQQQTTPEQEGTTGQARQSGNPAYCTEDSLASEATIRENCDNADALIQAGGGSFF